MQKWATTFSYWLFLHKIFIIDILQGSKFVSDHDTVTFSTQNFLQKLFFLRISVKRKIWVMSSHSQFLKRGYETTTETPRGTPLCQIYRNTHAQFRGNPKFSFSRCGSHSVKTDSLTFSWKHYHSRERWGTKMGSKSVQSALKCK